MNRTTRRRNRRYDVNDIEGCFIVRIDVGVSNLSLAGMAIETRNTLIVGRTYPFRIRHENETVDINGRVMWCGLTGTMRFDDDVVPVFRAGIQFEDILDRDVLKLQKLIEQSGEFETGNAVHGRFVAQLDGTISEDEQAGFEVKKISLSGMLVDTDRAPRKDDVVPFEVHLESAELSGHGRIVHIDPYLHSSGEQRFRLGIEYTLLSDRSRSTLEQFIAQLVNEDTRASTA